jgi:phage tail sheath gpL-like
MSTSKILFDSIPQGIRKPGQYIEFNTRLAVNSLPANVQKMIVLGQKLRDATAWVTATAYTIGKIIEPVTANGHVYMCVTAGTSSGSEPTWPTTQGGEILDGSTLLWKEIGTDSTLIAQLVVKQLFSDSDAKTYFGDGCMIHSMATAALRANPYLQLFAIAVDDAAGVNASGTITVSGAPSGSGSVRIWIGDQYVDVSFTSTSTPTTIATDIKAAIAAKSFLPVTSKSTAGVVTVIFKHAGVVGNQLKLATDFTASGSLNVVLVQLAGGTTDPDIHATNGVLDKIYPERYDIIATPYNDSTSLGYVKTHLESVSGPIEQRPGICVAGVVDTIANAQTLADSLNHGRTLLAHVKAGKSPAFVVGASVASIIASQSHPAMPYDDKTVSAVLAPAVTDRSSRTEQETMLLHGITPLQVDSETVTIVRAVSTYQSDASFLDITTVRTLDYIREAVKTRIKLRFSGTLLNDRRLGDIRAEIIVVLKQLESMEVLENVDANIDGVVVERDITDVTRVNAKIPSDIVNGLHVFAARIDLIL